jgi:hypothetical protein
MDQIMLTERLLNQGFSYDEIGRSCRRGELRRIRRGAYAAVAPNQSVVDRHRQMIMATVPQLRADAVVSHTSAAVLHFLPVPDRALAKVHLTRPRTVGGGKQRSLIALHSSRLEAPDITQIDGVPVTSLARTVFDLARSMPFDQAVAAGDRALAIGMAIELLSDMLERGKYWGGIRAAQRVTSFIDGRAESVGESYSRVRCHQLNLPAPEPQLKIVDRGQIVARCDLGWAEFGTVGEFDGRIKYGRLLLPGETAEDAVVREKRREDRIRDLGWQVVRWIWVELFGFEVVRDRLARAFARGRRSVIEAGNPPTQPDGRTPDSCVAPSAEGALPEQRVRPEK